MHIARIVGVGYSMAKKIMWGVCLSLLMTHTPLAKSMVIDAPHNEATSGIQCGSCHTYSLWWRYSPAGPDSSPDHGTITTTVCLQCHNTPDGPTPYKKSHSSLSFGATAQHGDWSTNCIDCHDPHFQAQLDWRSENRSELFLVTGTIGDAASFVDHGNGTMTFTYTLTGAKPAWSAPESWTNKTAEARSLILVDDTQQAANTYMLVAADATSITVKGVLDATSAGHSFGLIYGQLLRSTIATPNNGSRAVRLFDPKSTFTVGGFTEPTAPSPQGVCQVCHTVTKYWRNDGSLTDHNPGESCTRCHPARYGFAHGGGAEGGGSGCQDCHGKAASAGGHGTTASHATHTASDADHLKGPRITCDACHDSNNFPFFKTGLDSNGDGKFSRAETDVCDSCHSPGGTYDGVNDPVIGAKANWQEGIYEADMVTLKAGKERWCATCHDESPASINGIPAPNVIGDEDAPSTYGTGYGFYQTGHGLANDQRYPASGGATAGAGLGCPSCHDLSLAHTDGSARTFSCEDGCDSSEYRQGYRLRLINGQAPMEIPLTGYSNDQSQFRLCYSCHDSGPFLDGANLNTNLKSDGVNRHQYHLNFAHQLRYPADYNYGDSANSRITCVVCHNVHGSTRLAMVNDGRLSNREPGLKIWYNNPEQVSYSSTSPNSPLPESVPLTASTGTLISYGSSTNLCTHCHANNNVLPEYRTPYQNLSITSTDPAAGSGEVAINQAITILWDKEIDCSTVTLSTVTITPAVGWQQTSCGDQQATWQPSGQSGATLYTVTISTAIRSTDGGALALPYQFSYTTVAPTVAAPTMGTATPLSPTAIQWNFTDNATNEQGFTLHGPDHAVRVSQALVDLSSLTETGLTANTLYTQHVHAYRNGEDSPPSGMAAAYTLAMPPQVTADQATSTWFTTDEVVFTNAAGFGDGGVHYYRTAWDTNPTHVFADTETQWTSGTLTKTATAEGEWYLHVKAYNGDDVANASTVDFGPYAYDGVMLAVSSTAPSPGESRGVIDNPVTIHFNEDIDCATVTPATVTITPSVDWIRTSCSGGQAVFTPHGQTPSQLYTVTVAATVRDANAIPLSTGYQFAYTTVAAGTVTTVCQTGPCDFTSIQEAIDDPATTDGMVVNVVDSATYSEAINFHGKSITLLSAADATIAGNGANVPVVTFASGETASAVLDGFTIVNLAATAQSATRGIVIANGSSPTIRNAIIAGNAVANCTEENKVCGGGGVYIHNSSPTFATCTIRDNTIAYQPAGGVYVSGSASAPTFANTTISHNTSNRSCGGIYSDGATLTLTNCTITDNQTGSTSSYDGGGLYLNGATASATIADGTFSNNSGRWGGAILVSGSQAATPLSISNAIITANTGLLGAGIHLTGVSQPSTLTNTTISNNTAAQHAGGIYSQDAPLTLTECALTGNQAGSSGGGIFMSGTTASATIAGGTVSNNTATQTGGGIFLSGSTAATPLSVTNATVSANTSTTLAGGGLYLAGVSNPSILTGATISNNSAAQSGGGIFSNSPLTVTDTRIDGNRVTSSNFDGGGVYLTSPMASATMRNSSVTGNTARDGAGIAMTGDADLTVVSGRVTGNSCYGNGGGGGISVAANVGNGTTLTLTRSTVSGNRGGNYGGGIKNLGTATISNCTITGNSNDQQTYSDGGGIYSTGPLEVKNSTVAGNYAKHNGGGMTVTGLVAVKNSIVYGNTAGSTGPQINGTPTVSYSDIEGSFAGTANIASDPLFLAFSLPADQAGESMPKSSGDYHLQHGSPCCNTGNNDDAPPDLDLDGDSRIANGTVDMGADEVP